MHRLSIQCPSSSLILPLRVGCLSPHPQLSAKNLAQLTNLALRSATHRMPRGRSPRLHSLGALTASHDVPLTTGCALMKDSIPFSVQSKRARLTASPVAALTSPVATLACVRVVTLAASDTCDLLVQHVAKSSLLHARTCAHTYTYKHVHVERDPTSPELLYSAPSVGLDLTD